MDALVAHLPTAGERAERASAIRHEIARRTRRSVMTSSQLKVCPVCNTAKTHAEFNRWATRPDGLDWKCRACASVARRAAK